MILFRMIDANKTQEKRFVMKRERNNRTWFGIVWDNVYTLFTGKFRDELTDLNTLCDGAIKSAARKAARPFVKRSAPLTREQRKQIRRFYRPYVPFVTTRYHKIYSEQSSRGFCVEYIPDELFYTDIDRFYNGRKEARYLDNKCYYQQIFHNIRQPRLVAMRCGKCWFDSFGELVSKEEVIKLIQKEPEVVIKKALNSEGGQGVCFVKGTSDDISLQKIVNDITYDVVIQEVVKQHEELATLHESSVNTIRVISLLNETEVKIYSALIRIGHGKSRVDNTSAGAALCGIDEKGYLSTHAYYDDGRVGEKHPELGYCFRDMKISYMTQVYELVRQAHRCVPHFRLVSWDIAVNQKGEAVLIEANFSLGGIENSQSLQGPLFGDDTKYILDEVYGKRK